MFDGIYSLVVVFGFCLSGSFGGIEWHGWVEKGIESMRILVDGDVLRKFQRNLKELNWIKICADKTNTEGMKMIDCF